MATKKAITKKEVTSSHPNKKPPSSSSEVTEAWLNQLIRKTRECIVSEGKSVTLKMEKTKFESLIEVATRAKRFKSLNEKYAKLAEDYEKRDDEVLDWLIKSEYAKKALPGKEILPKHRREAIHRMGFEAPKIGRPIYYDPIRVKDFYESAKDAALKKFGKKKLSQRDHAWIVAKVFKEFSFASENATRQYLKVELKIKGLPW
jgi:hypothetical protein